MQAARSFYHSIAGDARRRARGAIVAALATAFLGIAPSFDLEASESLAVAQKGGILLDRLPEAALYPIAG